MKKDIIFSLALLVIGAVLCLLKFTGLTAHIVISVLGIIALVSYTVLTKKEWKIPALEIVMRAFYGIAIISGVVVMNVNDILALGIIHKVSAILFLVLTLALLAIKVIGKVKKDNK